MSRPPTSVAALPTRRFWFARAVLAVGVLALTLLVTAPSPSGAATNGDYTVELSKTTGIVDGEVIDITVSASPEIVPDSLIAHVALCRPGANLADDPLIAIQKDAGNCVYDGGSIGSSDFAVFQGSPARQIGSLLHQSGKLMMPWAMGTGTAEWSTAIGTNVVNYSLTCDASHPCSVVVLLGTGTNYASFIFPVTFNDSSPSAACRGAASAISGSHPFRLAELWSTETRAACALPGAQGPPTASAASGEDENLKSFGSGHDDITFTGVGYHDPTVLNDTEQRPSVAVPVALNASVLAFSGGTVNDEGRKVPYEPLRVTLLEFAQITGGGMSFMSFPFPDHRWKPILDRNPAFAAERANDPFNIQSTDTSGIIKFPMVVANGDAATWTATRSFATVLGAGWKNYPNYTVDVPVCDPPEPGNDLCPVKRGVTLTAAQAQPAFDQLATINGTPAMRKLLNANDNPRDPTPRHSISVVTDAATANWLGVTPAAITSTPSGSDFVAPTPASMAAAVPGMTKDENGMRFADPTKIPAGAYPMTFVEYALVPAAPKSDATTCTLRSWLTFLTTGGQQHLGGGVAPLTPDLQADAKDAIAKVGPGTQCAGDPPPAVTPPPDAGGAGPGGVGGYGPGGVPSAASLKTGALGSAGLGSVSNEDAGAATTPTSTEPPIAVVVPDYAGSRTAGALAAVGAVVLLGFLTWFAAMYSARKLPWQQPPVEDEAEGPQVFAVSGSPLDVIELD